MSASMVNRYLDKRARLNSTYLFHVGLNSAVDSVLFIGLFFE
ncbi:MAG: hypothetical protein H6Q59_3367 [Firmicutes bacterium]|nr:hypothetical protein [Bacillota bacterium]